MAASLTVSVVVGQQTPIVGTPINFWATITNTGTNAATLNSVSVSCPIAGVTIAQPDFLTPNVAPGVGNPVIAGSNGTQLVRFSVVFPEPNASGPSPQSPTGATGAVSQPAFPVSGYFPLLVQASITDSAGSTAVAQGGIGVGVLSLMQNVPRAEGGAMDWRQGSNMLGVVPAWP